MSQKPNHRRGEPRHQDNGPTYENPTPNSGCNSTHVARSRAKWKRRIAKAERRTGAPLNGNKYRASGRRAQPIAPDEEK